MSGSWTPFHVSGPPRSINFLQNSAIQAQDAHNNNMQRLVWSYMMQSKGNVMNLKPGIYNFPKPTYQATGVANASEMRERTKKTYKVQVIIPNSFKPKVITCNVSDGQKFIKMTK